MNVPLVSVCMITYNHAPYIAEAIEGVMMQKCDFPFELIIGEDYSTDDTRSIVLSYKEKYPENIRLLLRNTNMGMLQNFKDTLCSATGKYIALCEGDDYWIDSYKLQKQVDILENDDNVMLVHSKVKLRTGDREFDDVLIKAQQKNTPLALLMANQITTLTVLFRRDVLRKAQELIAQSQTKFPMGDYPLWLAIALQGKIVLLEDCTGVYRVLRNSASHSKDKKKMYAFEKGVLDVKLFFYDQYKKSMAISGAYHYKFQEMVFHSRKRMLLDYGWMARKQLVKLIRTPFSVWKYVISSKLKRKNA